MTWPFEPLQPFSASAIIADPPWLFELHSKTGEAKSPQAQYACMGTEAIMELPVGHLAGRDCVLFMWATFPMLDDAREVMRAWGFRYATGGSWAKQSKTGKKWAFGTGFVLRSAAELFLVGVNGRINRAADERNLIVAPVREHSRKPGDQYRIAEKLDPGHGQRIELFARQTAPGWTAWGNEVGKFGEVAA